MTITKLKDYKITGYIEHPGKNIIEIAVIASIWSDSFIILSSNYYICESIRTIRSIDSHIALIDYAWKYEHKKVILHNPEILEEIKEYIKSMK